jgi:FKBP-type peptidyl-prolyl cis-trans isomerase 2
MKEVVNAVIVLAAIVAVAGFVYALEEVEGRGFDEMLADWWENVTAKKEIEEGDFGQLYYVGYFPENGTVFVSSFSLNDSEVSYDMPFDDDRYNLTPFHFYFGETVPGQSDFPEGWTYLDLDDIEGERVADIPGLYNAIEGMKKNMEKTVVLDPDEGFGHLVENGTEFVTDMILGFNTTFAVAKVGGVTLDLRWVPHVGEVFTMPVYWYQTPMQDPYWLWENATTVVAFNETNATLSTMPNQLVNLTIFPWWENESSATYNETHITITTLPTVANFTWSYYGQAIYGEVLNVTDTSIDVRFTVGNQSIVETYDRDMVFGRTVDVPLVFESVQKSMVTGDIEDAGYSFHSLAGKTVAFRIRLLKVYPAN